MGDGPGTGTGSPPGDNRGGGPKTPEGIARRAEALDTHRADPEIAHLVHGVQGRPGVLMACDRCAVKGTCGDVEPGGRCRIEAAYLAERRPALLSLGHLDAVLDGPALDILLWTEVRLLRAGRYLAEVGELLPGAAQGFAEYQPLAREVPRLVASWRSTLTALGITPAARRALEAKGESGPAAALAAAFGELARQEREKAAATIDGEVTDEGDGGDG